MSACCSPTVPVAALGGTSVAEASDPRGCCGLFATADASAELSHRRSGHPMQSGELEFDLAGAAAHGADDDLDVVAELRHQFQQLGFADAAELAAGDA